MTYAKLIGVDIKNVADRFGRQLMASYRTKNNVSRVVAFPVFPDGPLSDFCATLRDMADKIEEDAGISR
jgi:hypothetical protein